MDKNIWYLYLEEFLVVALQRLCNVLHEANHPSIHPKLIVTLPRHPNQAYKLSVQRGR